jgi:uncharacterized protein YcfJ
MFLKGLTKVAATLVTMSPEEYYDIVREKDPLTGSLTGAAAGAAAGGIKGAKNKKAKAALVGAGAGAVGGALAGHQVSKVVKRYQAHKVRRIAEDLRLKSTPSRKNRAE